MVGYAEDMKRCKLSKKYPYKIIHRSIGKTPISLILSPFRAQRIEINVGQLLII
jgi:hypothetical protein